MSFLGCFDAIRKRNSKCLSYAGDGYWGASTLKSKSNRVDASPHEVKKYPQMPPQMPARPEADFWHVNVIPVGPFLEVLAAPDAFADAMEKRGKQVMEDWVELNKNIKKPGDRVVAEKQFILQSHSFRGPRGGPMENSQVEMQLTLWGYTANARKVDKPDPLLLRDVKVLALLRVNPLLWC